MTLMTDGSFDINHIANLARLQFSDEEKGRFTEQMEAIVAYVDKLRTLDVTGIEPTLHGQQVSNVFREDVQHACFDAETVLANAPERIDDEIKMPRVVE